MATYLELKEQAEKLMAQAEEMRGRETQQAIDDIKAKMKAFGLTARDLGFGGASSAGKRAPRKSNGSASKSPAKYRGPNGELWSGGRGRKPQWVVDALAEGKKLEDFAIK
jgi:DNA-binding protein H-NS